MVVTILITTIYLFYTGFSYYGTPLEERFYHPRHNWFKPSGIYGQGLGVLGTFLIAFGVFIYIARKRYNFLSKYIRLKYLLEFHIFLCTLGPILILFHTAFKFGGIVSVAFWSMVAVVLSGVIGRFIYIQIPRTIEGRELSLNEVKGMKRDLASAIGARVAADDEFMNKIMIFTEGSEKNTRSITLGKLKSDLRRMNLPKQERRSVLKMIREERSLQRKIGRLDKMQRLFKYWHVAHMPFAIIMLVIVVIHVAVTVALGYKWIF